MYNVANRKDWEAEEWGCVDQFLNKLMVPKEDESGQVYSTVGRIVELMKMCESNKYPDRKLSPNDFSDAVIMGINKK